MLHRILSAILLCIYFHEVHCTDESVPGNSRKLIRKRDGPVSASVLDKNFNPSISTENEAGLKLSDEEELFLRYLQAETSLSFSYEYPSSVPSQIPTAFPSQTPTVPPGTPTKKPTTPAPNNQPTQAPNNQPTQAPNNQPTQAPNNQSCKSSGVKFRLGGPGSATKKSCKWVGARPNKKARRCAYTDVKSHCPDECGACSQYACKDSDKFWFLWGKKNKLKKARTCNWVKRKKQLTPKRCGKNGVAATCRETCGWCTNNGMN